jgi:hypothetical protein
MGLSKKYCHPEFISESRHAELDSASIGYRHAELVSASIESCHAELVSASLVQGRFRVRPGMTAAAGSEWHGKSC